MSPGDFVFLLISVACCLQVFSASYKCPGRAEYSLSFYGMWNNITHSNAFPFMGHFSPLIGCSHEDAYTMWAFGIKASQGVEAVAEIGNATALYNEINMAIMKDKTAWKAFMASGPTKGTGHAMGLDVEVTRDFSLVSLVTMLAPSPDWFTGIMKMDLCDTSSGTWRYNMTMNMLQPWDAGTEEGNMFSTNNMPTDPVQNITLITKSSDTPFKNVQQGSIATLGKLVFQRKNPLDMTQQCSGEETYNVKFEGMWTAQSHPNGYPSNPHFSPLVGATHTYRYQFWGDMIRASPGVKQVAETGFTVSLYNEIKTSMKPNFVFRSYKEDIAVGAHSSKTIREMKVKGGYSRVSLITMIAPSPDWFVGVDGYELCGSNGQWKDSATVDLFAWDAGTDHGFSFASANNATMPPDVIKIITVNSDTVIKDDASTPFARITFRRKQVLVPTSSVIISQPPSTESGSQSPSTESGSQSPSTESGSQSPSTESGSQFPSTESGSQPPSTESGSQSPSTESGSQSPSTESGSQSPSTESGSQPPSTESGSQSPSTESGSQPPSTESGSQFPSTESGSQPPSTESGSQSPSTESGSQSPSTESGSQPPSTESGSQSPSTESGSQPPSTDNSGENEKSEGNSAQNRGCGSVSLIFLVAAVMQAF